MQNDTPVNLKQFGNTSFIVKNPDGVGVDLARLDSSIQFKLFADRVFTAGYFFAGLDYPAFQRLLSDFTPEMIELRGSLGAQKSGVLRFAADIVVFAQDRRVLYKSPNVAGGEAEYLFAPVMIDKTVDVPLYGEGADGTHRVVGSEKRVVQVRGVLSFDEFVAEMWTKGVRFGIDSDIVQGMILHGDTGRMVIARPLPALEGVDASLKEQSSKLYRDDTPRKRADGVIDLRQFKNRFPQIKKGERLLQKLPSKPGKPGMGIGGLTIAAPLPEDFDFATLVGEGTHLERIAGGEFIVASMDGFLNLDTATNRIAVAEKIINYSGVSMRTTGDIALEGEHFEEHGEVQEKRIIEGRSITVMADVYGKIISSGGKVHLRQNLVGGSASNQEGNITIDGLASNAYVEARNGTVTIARAENSVILGQHVVLESAISCTVVAQSIEIQTARGSLIGGKKIHIESAAARKDMMTMVAVLLPDLSGLNRRISILQAQIDELATKILQLKQKYEQMAESRDVKSYFSIAGKWQRKEIVLTAEQKINLQKLGARLGPSLKAATQINNDMQALREEQKQLEAQIATHVQAGKDAAQGVICSIEQLSADTQVRKVRANLDALMALAPKELKAMLHDHGPVEDQLPQAGEMFFWKLQASAEKGPGAN